MCKPAEYLGSFSAFPSVLRMAACAFVFHACVSGAAPKAGCDAPDFDFGALDGDAVVRHVFTVANQGDELLNLSVAVACCGSKVTISRPLLAPRETAEVAVEVKLLGYVDKIRKVVFLATNDPRQPYLQLGVSGRIVGTVYSSPGEIAWQDDEPDLPTSQIVTLRCEGRAFQVTNLTVNADWLKASLLAPSNGMARVSVLALPTSRSGTCRANVLIGLDAPPGLIAIPVVLKRNEAVTAYPNELLLPELASEGGASRVVAIRASGGKPFEVVSVALEGVEGKFGVEAVRKGEWRLKLDHLSVIPTFTNGCRVTVETDLPARRHVEIPVRVVTPVPHI